jgi:hypothetical protein
LLATTRSGVDKAFGSLSFGSIDQLKGLVVVGCFFFCDAPHKVLLAANCSATAVEAISTVVLLIATALSKISRPP